MIISLSEAKAQLSKIVDLACRGEEVVIAQSKTRSLKIMTCDADFSQYDCKIVS